MTDLAVVDKVTGEYIKAGEQTLAELAVEMRGLFSRREKDNWDIGRIAAIARAKCEDNDCGIEGDNPDARFGAWVSDNLLDTPEHTILRYRRLWEVFGWRREEVSHIPQSGLYMLAEPKADDIREEIVQLLAEAKNVRVADVEELIKNRLTHNHRAQGTGQNEWYTPSKYIELAREVMERIELDPATSEIANETVKADQIFTVADNGLERDWHGNVWMNPPYSQPLIQQFADKLSDEYENGNVVSAIALTHNYTDTAWFHRLANSCSAICFTRGRVAFLSKDGEKAAPTQGQAFFYFGDDVSRFFDAFSAVGIVVKL